jgi:hypothetical protein
MGGFEIAAAGPTKADNNDARPCDYIRDGASAQISSLGSRQSAVILR